MKVMEFHVSLMLSDQAANIEAWPVDAYGELEMFTVLR